MLQYLSIKNYALIDNLQIDFKENFNVLTGETGAGKSILIGGLRVLLGDRVDQNVFRDKKAPVVVEGTFDFDKLPILDAFLKEQDSLEVSKEDSLILRREIQPNGKSRCFVNGQAVNLSLLKEIGKRLVDLHGQYDHQLLFDPENHLKFLDDFGGIRKKFTDYSKYYQEYLSLVKIKRELEENESNKARELDLLQYQIDEIEKADLKADEEFALEKEKILLANAEQIHEKVQAAYDLLYQGSGSAVERLNQTLEKTQDLNHFDNSFKKLSEDIEKAFVFCDESARELQKYLATVSFDPERLEVIQDKLSLIDQLKRKYGSSSKEILTFLEKARERKEILDMNEEKAEEFEKKLEQTTKKLLGIAEKIRKERKALGAQFKKKIEKELQDLGMKDAVIEVSFREDSIREFGCDQVEFLISPNKGEEVKPLSKIASGGEISRVMLAFKKILASVDQVGTLIFDEIDANIGGRLGKVVGEKMKQIAKDRQILIITHLPQIASLADAHFKVEKHTHGKRVITTCMELNKKERVSEVAQMMSGKDFSATSKKHAEEMIESV